MGPGSRYTGAPQRPQRQWYDDWGPGAILASGVAPGPLGGLVGPQEQKMTIEINGSDPGAGVATMQAPQSAEADVWADPASSDPWGPPSPASTQPLGGLMNADGSAYYDPAQDWDSSGALDVGDTYAGASDPYDWRRILGTAGQIAGASSKALGGSKMTVPEIPNVAPGSMRGLEAIPMKFILPLMELFNRTRQQ